MQLNNESKKRLTADLRGLLLFFAVGLFYYLFVRITNFRIPCVFYVLTGFLCPGCGVTRMCMSIIQLDFKSAFGYNKLVFSTLPIFFYIFMSMEYNYIKYGNRKPGKIAEALAYFEAVAMTIFFVVRNII